MIRGNSVHCINRFCVLDRVVDAGLDVVYSVFQSGILVEVALSLMCWALSAAKWGAQTHLNTSFRNTWHSLQGRKRQEIWFPCKPRPPFLTPEVAGRVTKMAPPRQILGVLHCTGILTTLQPVDSVRCKLFFQVIKGVCRPCSLSLCWLDHYH